MKWNELQEKAKVKLLVDLRVISDAKLERYAYLTPSDLDEVAPIVHAKGSCFTVYKEGVAINTVELFNEQDDSVLFMAPNEEIPAHFVVL